MITEPRAVICGVTFISRAALMYWVVMVLFWLVWMGMRSPCVISAGMLFWVVARGEEMSRPLPLRVRALRARSRLKVPAMLPREIFGEHHAVGGRQVDGVAVGVGLGVRHRRR